MQDLGAVYEALGRVPVVGCLAGAGVKRVGFICDSIRNRIAVFQAGRRVPFEASLAGTGVDRVSSTCDSMRNHRAVF